MTRTNVISLEGFVTEFNGLRQEDWTRDQWKRVIELTTILPDSLLQLGDATWIVGNKFGLTDSAMKSMWDKLLAATDSDLVVYDPKDLLPFVPKSRVERRPWAIMVRADELDAWFASHRAPYRLIDPAEKTPQGEREDSDSSNTPSTWRLAPNKRIQGYTVYLRSTLRAMLADGLPVPTAREVLEHWRKNKPTGIYKVMYDCIEYGDANGEPKEANLDAIRKAIARNTSTL